MFAYLGDWIIRYRPLHKLSIQYVYVGFTEYVFWCSKDYCFLTFVGLTNCFSLTTLFTTIQMYYTVIYISNFFTHTHTQTVILHIRGYSFIGVLSTNSLFFIPSLIVHMIRWKDTFSSTFHFFLYIKNKWTYTYFFKTFLFNYRFKQWPPPYSWSNHHPS